MLFLKHFSSRYLCHQWVTRQDLLNAGPVRSDWGLPRPCPAQLRSEESENNGGIPLCCSRGEERSSRTGFGAHGHTGTETGDSQSPSRWGPASSRARSAARSRRGGAPKLAGTKWDANILLTFQTCVLLPLGGARKQKLSGKTDPCDCCN